MKAALRAALPALLAASWPIVAAAQGFLPIPGGGAEPAPSSQPSEGEAADAGPRVDNDKSYTAPERSPLPEGEARALAGPIAVVAFDAMVSPGMGEYVMDSITKAEGAGVQFVLIEMDTPGGLVSTTEKMVQSILTSRVPVVVHITPSGAHAASAGTFITLAAHVAVMSPATRIGAAHPVTGGGKDPEAEGGKHMAAKVENDLLALVEGIAKHRSRNVEWAKDAVKHSVSAHAERAVEIGVVDFIASDRADLLQKLHGRELMLGDEKVALSTEGAVIEVYDPSIRDRLLALLANPGIAMLLGILGLIGIMVEFYNPGLVVPGVMGVLAILCSLIAMEQLPIDVGAAILTIAGLALLVAEIYTPTYGALGILGTIGLTVGGVLLVDPADPDFAVDPSISLDLVDVLPMVALMAGFVAFVGYYVVKARRLAPTTGSEALVGATGEVLQTVGPDGGQVFVGGEYWKARSAETLEPKTPIVVAGVSGLVLEVRRRDA